MKITYHDGRMDRQLASWDWPTDGNFEVLANVAKLSASALTDFYARRAKATVQIAPAEEAEAMRRGPDALMQLHVGKRRQADRAIALETLATLATREQGLRHELQRLAKRMDELSTPAPWNELSLQLDRWVLDHFGAQSRETRGELFLRAQRGEAPELAAALLRAPRHLLPDEITDAKRAELREAIARAIAPEEVQQIEQARRAADIAREAWTRAVKEVTAPELGIEPGEVRAILGDETYARFTSPPAPHFSAAHALGLAN